MPLMELEVRPKDGGRNKFYHPYQPYGIQKTFMSELYECIETGKVGIFESPTG
jgi:chromosome transmission fidelity protein 1